MIRALVVGLGNMGRCHADALLRHSDVELVGLVNRSSVELDAAFDGIERFSDFEQALETLKPDLVCIASYTDSHASFAVSAMQSGAHVFVEKPLAATIQDAEWMIQTAVETNRKLVVGYILRHHPSWVRMVEEAKSLTGPYVFRFNLNQQSTGPNWDTHKALMQSTSPIVDCGVHYVDLMCQIVDARPVSVNGMGLRLSEEIPTDMYNYGQLQVTFDDGSVGWYEAGWGPMMSETASFVKDVVATDGSVSIVDANRNETDDVESHTNVGEIKVHRLSADETIQLQDEPSHQQLCDSEQNYMVDVIKNDTDLTRHMNDALQSLKICLLADQSIRTGSQIHIKDTLQ
jgi:predicted dehydrogenase